ncbi:MAG: hypothetical protein ACLGIN_05140 [Candidatus Sericytochromatia bacterium]
MKKLLPAVLALALLAGCGQAPGLVGASKARMGAVSAQSKAGTEKGVRGMFKLIFSKFDQDQSGFLTIEEAPGKLHFFGPADDTPANPQAVMATLDLNQDGKVTLREFSRRELLQPVLLAFRYEAGKIFVNLDKNADRALTEEELAGTPYTVESLDRNGNGKIPMSEFEDGLAAILAEQGSLGGPVEPAPAEPGGDEPGGDEPSGDEPDPDSEY